MKPPSPSIVVLILRAGTSEAATSLREALEAVAGVRAFIGTPESPLPVDSGGAALDSDEQRYRWLMAASTSARITVSATPDRSEQE